MLFARALSDDKIEWLKIRKEVILFLEYRSRRPTTTTIRHSWFTIANGYCECLSVCSHLKVRDPHSVVCISGSWVCLRVSSYFGYVHWFWKSNMYFPLTFFFLLYINILRFSFSLPLKLNEEYSMDLHIATGCVLRSTYIGIAIIQNINYTYLKFVCQKRWSGGDLLNCLCNMARSIAEYKVNYTNWTQMHRISVYAQ